MNYEIIPFTKHHDPRGNLSVVEAFNPVPYEIRRVYWLYDVPAGSERGGHSHKQQKEVLVAMAGSFNVVLDDGEQQLTVTLNRPDRGLLIGEGMWRVLDNFSAGSVCLVLASDVFDENDYIRDYDDFLASKGLK
ncbi:MAG: WxcM-like domain-containing protein [Muribaculaceae bacterium]|nr:WxcM-like domain-containing protein [Muribaculaceae bacterium]